MLIAGLQKMSMMDYPQKPCCVVFTPYCNMNCTYCHNYHILGKDATLMDEEAVFAFLEKRRGVLEAVTVSGGEPTLQPNLKTFLKAVKEMGFLLKLDTNGSKPDVLCELFSEHLIDYVAMDLKTSEAKYAEVTRSNVKVADVKQSILLLKNYSVPHEFRTTFAPEMTKEDVLDAVDLIAGCETYYLQQYRKRFADDPEPHKPTYVQETAEAVREKLGTCIVRGL